MTLGTRSRLALLAATLTASALVSPALTSPGAADSPPLPPPPETVALPDGFQPEGIAVAGRFGYFGSRADGDIYRADLRTGRGQRISEGPGTPALGLKVGPLDRLYVAGGDSGTVRIVSTRTGKTLRTLRVNRGTAFVNDVVLTADAAWVTDSAAAQVYRVPIRRDGRLPRLADVRTIELRGAWEQPAEGEIGANGITESPDGKALLVVDSTAGELFRVERSGRRAGVAEKVRLRGADLSSGDGMLLEGRKLWVVRNRLNIVNVLKLDRDGDRGVKTRSFTSTDFDVPTTIARWRGAFYLPNARFTTPPTPTTTYDVVRVDQRPQR